MNGILLGLFTSVVVGAIVISLSMKIIRWWIDRQAKSENQEAPESITKKLYVSGFILGIIERPLISLLVACDISGVAGGIFTYIATKMAIDWIPLWKKEEGNMNYGARSYVFCSLIGNLLSVSFGVIGGLVWKSFK
jgi:hypothetical protein